MASITTAWHGLDLAAARAVLQKAIADGAFPGAAWGVLLDGDIIACEGAGRFTYDADAPPVSSETMYDLASLTKVVATTSIAMLLWQRSALDLDAPLGGWFPEFAAGESSAARGRVTLRMLLAHIFRPAGPRSTLGAGSTGVNQARGRRARSLHATSRSKARREPRRSIPTSASSCSELCSKKSPACRWKRCLPNGSPTRSGFATRVLAR